MKHDAIPGYVIEELIGKGGMASVYLATQKSLARPVAIKILKDTDSPELSERFVNEGRIIAGLNHSNIISIYDVGIADGMPYILMEYVSGGDLTRRISEGMKAGEALELIETIGRCLHFTHQKGVIHRDIKPTNILFRGDGTPVINDFGIAKQLSNNSDLTKTRIALGSPYYISPEQAVGTVTDARTDIYSLGITLYEMLTGEKPHQGGTDIATVVKHLQEPFPRLPPGYHRYQVLLDRMTARALDQRFTNAAQLVDFVKELRESTERPPDLKSARESEPEQWFAGAGELIDNMKRLRGYDFQQFWEKFARKISLFKRFSRRLVARVMRGDLPNPSVAKKQILVSCGVLVLIVTLFGFIGSSQDQSSEPIEISNAANTVPVDDIKPAQTQQANSETEGAWVKPKQQEIQKLLGMANDALVAYRLTTPPKVNALYYYERILELDPGNTDAERGLTEIADRYTHLAMRQIYEGHYNRARKYVELGLKIDPKNPRLKKLKSKMYLRKTRSGSGTASGWVSWKHLFDEIDRKMKNLF